MILGDKLGGRLYEDRDDLEGPAAERHGNPARPELPPAEVDLPLLACIDQIGACFRYTESPRAKALRNIAAAWAINRRLPIRGRLRMPRSEPWQFIIC
jgi:hypothetical protein